MDVVREDMQIVGVTRKLGDDDSLWRLLEKAKAKSEGRKS